MPLCLIGTLIPKLAPILTAPNAETIGKVTQKKDLRFNVSPLSIMYSKRNSISPTYFLAILKDLTLEFEAVVFDVTVKVAVQSTPGIRLEIEAVKGDVKLE